MKYYYYQHFSGRKLQTKILCLKNGIVLDFNLVSSKCAFHDQLKQMV